MAIHDQIVVIGAGPAGLTAAYELVKHGKTATILEADPVYVGGIARTVLYKGYRFDIGGHRFFSKSQEIMDLWQEVLGDDFLSRPRLSRWLYNGKFFDYPIKPLEILGVFGLLESFRMFLSYGWIKLFPIKPEVTLADYYINRFGRVLAKPFFIDYNDKLWGMPCNQLSPDFAKQRVKGISFISAIIDPVQQKLKWGGKQDVVKSFIPEFKYPRYGPGQMWEKFRDLVVAAGDTLHMGTRVVKVRHDEQKILALETQNAKGQCEEYVGDYVISSMPLRKMILSMDPPPPPEVVEAAKSLKLRDFITVALIVNRKDLFPDQWVYLHDKGMKPIRMQNFNNWSPYLVPDPNTTCLGFEYVCARGDSLWQMTDPQLIEQATSDLVRTGFAKREDVMDGAVVRTVDVYPVYTLDYEAKVNVIRDYFRRFDNLLHYQIQQVGRSGMHRYNNSDHSMMTALLAVRNILGQGPFDPWLVNVDAEYHEEAKADKS
ncbi:MAG: NAD(P)/FAD-dependent oxidoreductase [Chloroflexi bacterium]|nr:NAD(P)/FAD-dependent oxidoreductase [Chloroflexota bacterium]